MGEARHLLRLLNEIDGQLGLAVYRGEGTDQQWKGEARVLISRIRGVVKDLSADNCADPYYCCVHQAASARRPNDG